MTYQEKHRITRKISAQIRTRPVKGACPSQFYHCRKLNLADIAPIIYSQSIAVSGKNPKYELIDDAELKLTVWAGEGAIK
jgi:hypothetical protein